MTNQEAVKELSALMARQPDYAAALDKAIGALEKQIPLKHLPYEVVEDGAVLFPCGNCGNDVKKGSDFCPWCGQRGGQVMEEKLKPCPFCGCGEGNLYIVTVEQHGFDTVGIFCNGCKQTVILEENEWEGDNDQSRKKAIEAWNRRAENDRT